MLYYGVFKLGLYSLRNPKVTGKYTDLSMGAKIICVHLLTIGSGKFVSVNLTPSSQDLRVMA
jgi:hypothetical protein